MFLYSCKETNGLNEKLPNVIWFQLDFIGKFRIWPFEFNRQFRTKCQYEVKERLFADFGDEIECDRQRPDAVEIRLLKQVFVLILRNSI
jgi:hypothetical protein